MYQLSAKLGQNYK